MLNKYKQVSTQIIDKSTTDLGVQKNWWEQTLNMTISTHYYVATGILDGQDVSHLGV